MGNPLISIVMVNYNHEESIGESIESVIAQTWQNWELIIVDDGSTDSSPEIIKEYAQKDSRILPVLQAENNHICVATNIGLSKVRGEFVARLDSDDIWQPQKLEKQIQYMREHPEGSLCFTKLDIIDEKGRNINQDNPVLYDIYNGRQEGKKGWIRHFFYYGNTLIQSTLLMKREVLDTIGGFNLAYMQGHDFDFFTRAILKYDFIFLEEPLVKYRRASQQNSAWNEINNRRFFNEHMNIRPRFLDSMSDELFIEAFREDFVNPESKSKEELMCEKAFLLCKCIRGEEINPVLGLCRLEQLMHDPSMVTLLKEQFHYSPKDFYKQSAGMLYVTDGIAGELGYLKNLCPMQEERIKGLEQANQELREQLEEQAAYVRELENRVPGKIKKLLQNFKK